MAKRTKKAGSEYNLMRKQFNVILFIICGVLLVLVAILIIKQAETNFMYNGIKFEKHYQGSILLYTAKIPLRDSDGKVTGYLVEDFRNNPKILGSIPVTTIDGIRFIAGRTAYISYGELDAQCDNNSLAAVNLGIFLADAGIFLADAGISVKGALADEAATINTTIPYVTCDSQLGNTVIFVHSGNETEIKQTDTNCYEIITKDCEILSATERFQLAILEEYARKYI